MHRLLSAPTSRVWAPATLHGGSDGGGDLKYGYRPTEYKKR